MIVIDSVNGIPLDYLSPEFNGMKISSSVDGVPTDNIHKKPIGELSYKEDGFFRK